MLLCDCQSFIKESYLLTYENDDDDDARRFNILTDQRAFESDRSPLSLTHDVKIKKRTKMRKIRETKYSATVKSTAHPSCLVGVLYDISGRKFVDG